MEKQDILFSKFKLLLYCPVDENDVDNENIELKMYLCRRFLQDF